jgi:hypothetical protein
MVRWRYEWPLKREAKWPLQKLLTRIQQQMLRRWLRHVENFSDEGKRSGRGLVGFQVGNEKGSMDLIYCQVGRRDIQNCQLGRGGEMSSIERSRQQGELIDEEAEEIPRLEEDSRGMASRVNEDDDKLKKSITK